MKTPKQGKNRLKRPALGSVGDEIVARRKAVGWSLQSQLKAAVALLYATENKQPTDEESLRALAHNIQNPLSKIERNEYTKGKSKYLPYILRALDMQEAGNSNLSQNAILDRNTSLDNQDNKKPSIGQGQVRTLGRSTVFFTKEGGPGCEGAIFMIASEKKTIRSPLHLQSISSAFAFYMSGSSMVPKYGDGDLLWVNPTATPPIGSHVVACPIDSDTKQPLYSGQILYVGLLLAVTATHWKLHQYRDGDRDFATNEWACLLIDNSVDRLALALENPITL